MQTHALVALVTLIMLLVYFWMSLRVGRGRGLHKVEAPAMTGHPDFERLVRAHYNTMEWLPLAIVPMWIWAVFGGGGMILNDRVAAGLGLLWTIGRVMYALGYAAEAGKRSTGFLVQALAALVLMIGALWAVVTAMLVTGGI